MKGGGCDASVGALVIAGDDERHIRRCLASLSWAADCCLILDDRSRDATEAIAREVGARPWRDASDGRRLRILLGGAASS